MVTSLEEAIAILKKWKDESAHIVVAAESPSRRTFRGMQERGVRWAMIQDVKVSRVTPPAEGGGSKEGIVEFEGPSGNLSVSLGRCRFVYEDPREASFDVREEADKTTVSALSVLFPYDESFIFYEMREPLTEPSSL
jgi:hypothetical protein